MSLWDLSKIIYPKSTNKLLKSSESSNEEGIVRFNSLKQILQKINEENSKTFFIILTYCDIKAYKIFRSISEIGCKYGVIFAYSRGTVPPPVNKTPPYKRILNNLTNGGLPKKIIGKFFEVLLKKNPKFFGINYADCYIIGGGKLASHDCPLVGEDTFVQKIHAPDYDLFLEHKNQITKKQNDEFIVFIDQNFPYHSDAVIFNGDKIESKQYYPDLNNYFDIVEKHTKLKIVIAAHPKANYERKEYLFDGRKIVHGHNSAELISRSKLVIMHYSTAINLAVLFRKPILFITNDAINKTYRGESIENYTKLFDVSPLNISKEIGMGVPISNNKLYDDYIASYIKKPGTKEEFFWQQVADHISESY